MKKSIPKVRERESEASILGNDQEREFPITHVAKTPFSFEIYSFHHLPKLPFSFYLLL